VVVHEAAKGTHEVVGGRGGETVWEAGWVGRRWWCGREEGGVVRVAKERGSNK
jgi:hypothetical protein